MYKIRHYKLRRSYLLCADEIDCRLLGESVLVYRTVQHFTCVDLLLIQQKLHGSDIHLSNFIRNYYFSE